MNDQLSIRPSDLYAGIIEARGWAKDRYVEVEIGLTRRISDLMVMVRNPLLNRVICFQNAGENGLAERGDGVGHLCRREFPDVDVVAGLDVAGDRQADFDLAILIFTYCTMIDAHWQPSNLDAIGLRIGSQCLDRVVQVGLKVFDEDPVIPVAQCRR